MVTKSTFLYKELSIDSQYIMEMSVGTDLKSPTGETTLDCTYLYEGDTMYNLCEVEVIDTGQKGFVLEKWIK